MIVAALSRAAERAVPVLPGALDAPLAAIVGTAAYLAAPRSRSAVRANLSVIAATTGRVGSARRVFVEQVRHYLETFRLLRRGGRYRAHPCRGCSRVGEGAPHPRLTEPPAAVGGASAV